ncbi:hypothetical protein QBC39DRAFT_361503 [Podospora conica]|nr:hypothetical protein QBC39DRAFT_361503 [Schizothecium conicum]
MWVISLLVNSFRSENQTLGSRLGSVVSICLCNVNGSCHVTDIRHWIAADEQIFSLPPNPIVDTTKRNETKLSMMAMTVAIFRRVMDEKWVVCESPSVDSSLQFPDLKQGRDGEENPPRVFCRRVVFFFLQVPLDWIGGCLGVHGNNTTRYSTGAAASQEPFVRVVMMDIFNVRAMGQSTVFGCELELELCLSTRLLVRGLNP